tara:strand:- start:868 stop:1107 length:240 start_codon:yes stop_codon:yes gene_type:complete
VLARRRGAPTVVPPLGFISSPSVYGQEKVYLLTSGVADVSERTSKDKNKRINAPMHAVNTDLKFKEFAIFPPLGEDFYF